MTITFGGAWHALYKAGEPPPESTKLNSYLWEELSFRGTVTQIKQSSTGKYQLEIDIHTTVLPDNIRWEQSHLLRAVLDTAEIAFPKLLHPGAGITFDAIIYPLNNRRNPAQFDYKKHLASMGIHSQAGITKIVNIKPGEQSLFSWISLRQKVLAAINHNFSSQTAPLAKALLIGYKNELSRKDKIAFSRAGLSHIMAVSGLHVGFILAPFWICIPFFWTFRYGKQIGLLILLGFLLFYAGLTGFSASVTRASLVGGFLAYAKLFHKVRNSKNITAVAALIILLINPGDLFTIGFQLSFGAVYVILLTAPVISRSLPHWIRYRWYGQPIMAVLISFIVQMGLFPLLAYYFGEFSVVGPLANAFVIPILGIAVPAALFLIAISRLFPATAQLLNFPVDYFLAKLAQMVELTASWPWSWVQVQIDSLIFFGIWIMLIFFISSLPIPKLRWKMLGILLLFLCLDQSTTFIRKLQAPTLTLTVFDVGQGDASLVKTPSGKHILIDTGRWAPNYNSARHVIIPHLEARGIEKLDAVFLSHPHADHIGGIIELIETIPIGTIYNSGAKYKSELYKRYHRKAAEKNIPVVALSAGDQLPLDPAMRLFVYGPPAGVTASNVNNRSLILELVYGETEFLFMGDAELTQEKRLVTNFPRSTDTDFLKVAHHGSKTSSSRRFLSTASPEISAVSLGLRNRFGHPHMTSIQRLQKYSDLLLFTSLSGALILKSNGRYITEERWK